MKIFFKTLFLGLPLLFIQYAMLNAAFALMTAASDVEFMFGILLIALLLYLNVKIVNEVATHFFIKPKKEENNENTSV